MVEPQKVKGGDQRSMRALRLGRSIMARLLQMTLVRPIKSVRKKNQSNRLIEIAFTASVWSLRCCGGLFLSLVRSNSAPLSFSLRLHRTSAGTVFTCRSYILPNKSKTQFYGLQHEGTIAANKIWWTWSIDRLFLSIFTTMAGRMGAPPLPLLSLTRSSFHSCYPVTATLANHNLWCNPETL